MSVARERKLTNGAGVEHNRIEVQASCLLQMLESSSRQDQTPLALLATIILLDRHTTYLQSTAPNVGV